MITIPTIAELRASIQADIESTYGSTIPSFGKNFLRVMSYVQAAKLKMYYLAIGNLQKNVFIDTADPESKGGTLERFGRVKLGRNPFPATAGQYDITVTGTVGAIVPAQTTFKSDDDSSNPGKLFILDNEFELLTSPDTITVRALEAGVDSQLFVGETLTATAPIAEVDKGATVSAEVVEPFAAEDIELYRQKGLEAYRTEPQGGAGSDYRLWSKDAQGVEQAYPYATPGEDSQVDLYIEATVADSTDGKGTPSAGLLADVEEVVDFDPDTTKPLEERGRRPITVVVNYLPVTPLDVDIEITGLLDSTPAIEAAIEAALTELISGIRPFVSSVDVLADKNDILDTNKIIAKILEANPGSIFTSVELQVNSVIVSTYTFENGDIPYTNSVTFV
jgi:uncharacterized phage protein gp47/JayE